MSHHVDFPGRKHESTLSAAWEQLGAPRGGPVAVEFTFTPEESPATIHIPRLDLSVGLAIDRSGSMAGDKLAAAKRAAVGVLEALHDGERFAAAAFDSTVIDVTPSVPLDDRARTRIHDRLASLHDGGSTALFDGYARTAELVATGSHPAESDTWVIVLSDGMGNHGLVDPRTMRTHAAALADRGIRTISIGIGTDYEASQLTALAEGGSGEFHHASKPDEIVEIVLGELRNLRVIAARDVRLRVSMRGAQSWVLLGGDSSQDGNVGESRFDRVTTGRVLRTVALVWPTDEGILPRLDASARWLDRELSPKDTQLQITGSTAPPTRNIPLAGRAARLWHAQIMARSLELNERGEYGEAESYVRNSRREFDRYVEGLPEMQELTASLETVSHRVGREWKTAGHREAYVMSRKALFAKPDVRESSPASYQAALLRDEEWRGA